MKKKLIFIFCNLIFSYSNCQNQIINEYLYLEKVNFYNSKNDNKKAIEFINKIKTPHIIAANNYMNFANIHIKNKDTISAQEFVFKSICKGGEYSWLNDYPQLKPLFTIADSMYFLNTYKQNKNKIDVDLYSSIQSMYDLDQFVRRRWVITRDTTYLNDMCFIDSNNSIKVYSIIDEKGFSFCDFAPLERLFIPLFLHISDKTLDSLEFESYRLKIFEEVLKGNLAPSTYAVWVDRHYVFSLKMPQLYGTFWEQTDKGKELKNVQFPDKIDELRTSIGLLSIGEYLEIKTENIFPSWYKN